MLADLLHPLPIATLDRYTAFIYGCLCANTNRPQTLRHLETLLQFETDYLVALGELLHKGKHFHALAALSDDELAELDLSAELTTQQGMVAELESWQAALLAVIMGEAADESLIGLESRVEALYYVE